MAAVDNQPASKLDPKHTGLSAVVPCRIRSLLQSAHASSLLMIWGVGYVLKHGATPELPKAVSEVLQGRSYVTLKLRSDARTIPSVVDGL